MTAVEIIDQAEEEQRQRRRASALHDVAIALNETDALGDLLPRLAERTAEALAADRVGIYVYDEALEQVLMVYRHGDTPEELARARHFDQKPPRDCPGERRMLETGDLVTDPTVLNAYSPSASDLVALTPLAAHGEILGALYVRRRDGGAAYDAWELSLLKAIGGQGGIAVERARLADAATRRADHLALLNQLGRELSGTLALDELSAVIHEQVRRVLVADAFFVALHEDGDDHVWFPYMFDEGRVWNSKTHALNDGPTTRVVRTHQPFVMHPWHAQASLGLTAFGNEGRESAAAVYVPMLHHDRLIGVLSVQRYDPNSYDEDDVRTLGIIAQQAAASLAHARLYAESLAGKDAAERHAANLEAVLTTTRAITSQVELTDTLGVLADHVERLIPHERLIVWRADDATAVFSLYLGRSQGQPFAPDWDLPVDRGVIGRVLRDGMPALVNNAHLAPEAYFPPTFPHPMQAEHMLVGPLVAAGRTIGVLMLDRSRGNQFTNEDFAIFEVLAAQAGVALQASLLFEEERRRRQQATALVEVAGALNRANTLDDVVQHLTDAVTNTVGTDCCSVYVYDETAEHTIASATVGYPDLSILPALAVEPPSAFPVEQELLATGAAVVGERLRTLMAEQRQTTHDGPRASAAVPLRLGGRVHGVMYLWSSSESDNDGSVCDFDAYEVSLLEAIGEQAAVAIERARLYADTERRVAELRVLGGVGEAIAQSLDLATVVQGALHRVGEVVPHSDGLVALWDEESASLKIAQSWGEHADRPLGMTFPLDASVNGLVFQTGEARVGAASDEAPFFQLPGVDRCDLFYLCVPLQIEQQVIGTLYVQRQEGPTFTSTDLALFRLLAGQLAVGIQRIQIYELTLEARERSDRQTLSLQTVLANSQLLALQTDLDSTLSTFTEGVFQLVRYSACAIYRADGDEGVLRQIYDRVVEEPGIPVRSLRFGEGITGEAALRREAICVANAEWDGRTKFEDNSPEAIDFYRERELHVMAVPLLVEGSLIGAVTITRVGDSPFSDEEFAAVRVYAGQTAAAIRNAELLVGNRDLYLGGIRALASAVDAKDAYTRGHSGRVSQYAREIAEELGLDQIAAEQVELAGLLHDIGKIGIPDAILQKPSQLDDAERAVMMGHTDLGAEILSEAGADALMPLVPLVRHHHEWHNGGGYPDGLEGDQIPLGSAIISVADAYDTIVTDRPYRGRRAAVDAVAELRVAAGTQFRPEVVDALAQLVDATELPAGNDASALVRLSSGDRPADHEHGAASPPVPRSAGQMGDLRALGLLVELAGITQHIPDLHEFLNHVAVMVRRRLGYEDVMLLLVDEERRELVVAAHSSENARSIENRRLSIDSGICGVVVRSGRARNVKDTRNEPSVVATWPAPHRSELAVPLIVDGNTIGLINVESPRIAAFTSADEAVLTAVAGQVATAIHVAQLHAAAKHAAATDGLTGLANHRAFYEALEQAIRTGQELCVMVLDVEGLKQVNDSAGHLAGDALLRLVSESIRRSVRASDVVARFGGDEFGVIMRGITFDAAIAVGDRIRGSVLEASSREMGLPRATVRYGVAVLPDDGVGPYDLIAVADDRLYDMRARSNEVASPTLVVGD